MSVSQGDTAIVRTAVFDAASWNHSVFDNTTELLYGGIWGESLPYPLWVLDNATFEPFTPLNLPLDLHVSEYQANTRGFFPGMDCEIARIDGDPVITNNLSNSAHMSFTSSSCQVELELSLVDPTQAYDRMYKWLDKNLMGNIQQIRCPDETQRYFVSDTLVDADIKLLRSR